MRDLSAEMRMLQDEMSMLTTEIRRLRQRIEGAVEGTERQPTAAAPDADLEMGQASALPSIQEELVGKRFAWCHDGQERTGLISFESGGKTGEMAPAWTLSRWRVTGPFEVTMEAADGSNQHVLHFNEQLTGFYCEHSGQRGFVQGEGFYSADDAGAPSSPSQAGQRMPLAGRGGSPGQTKFQAPGGPALGMASKALSAEDERIIQETFDRIMEKRLRGV